MALEGLAKVFFTYCYVRRGNDLDRDMLEQVRGTCEYAGGYID
jgi:hypothetical protein